MGASDNARNQRQRLLSELDRQLALARGRGQRLALLVFNLHRFREINISHGHPAGDAVLEEVAQRMRSTLRPGDGLFHIGNDEFAVLLTELRSPQVASLAARKILQCINSDYQLPGAALAVAAVAGGAVFPDHAGDRDALLRGADTALHMAREQDQDFVIYDASLVAREQQLANLRGSLRKALENDELML